MEIGTKPLTVDLIVGVAAGVLQFMALQTVGTAWDTYAGTVHTIGAPTLPQAFVDATKTLTDALDPAFKQAQMAALVAVGAQLLGW